MTDEGHIRDALRLIVRSIILERQGSPADLIPDPKNPAEGTAHRGVVTHGWLLDALDHIEAIRVRGDKAREAKAAADDE